MILLFDVYGVCMQLYEIILAVLGIVLFIAAIIFTALKYDVKLLVSMYLISIVMIAFPALSKIVFADVTLEVQRLQCTTEKLANNPNDSSLKQQVRQQIDEAKKAGIDSTNAKTVVTIATANAVLGDSVKAAVWADKGLQFSPDSKTLQNFRNSVLTPRINVEYQIQKLQQNPADSNTKQQLELNVEQLQSSAAPNTAVFTTLSKANLVLGDTAQARKLVDSALLQNPKNKEAIILKRNIQIKSSAIPHR